MAIYLMLLGINFIGLSYILVYVGAVSILFLFILMLINIRISELSSNTSNSLILAILVIYILYTDIENLIPYKSELDITNTLPGLSILANYYDSTNVLNNITAAF
jgi:NADH-ubiquinone oxidoreductase chain 6